MCSRQAKTRKVDAEYVLETYETNESGGRTKMESHEGGLNQQWACRIGRFTFFVTPFLIEIIEVKLLILLCDVQFIVLPLELGGVT